METDTNKSKNTTLILAIAVIAIVILVAGGGYFLMKNKSSNAPVITEKVIENDGVNNATNENASTQYKNGTYEASGTYTSPGGTESIDVSLVLEGDVITSATVTPKATRPNSVKYQGLFKENFESEVVGKNIDEVNLDKVGGSSLTPKGFMDALEEIKSQATV